MARPPMQPETGAPDDYDDPGHEDYVVDRELVGRLIRTLDGTRLIRVPDDEVTEYLLTRRRWPR